MAKKDAHEHKFTKRVTKKVLLASFIHDEGETKYNSTTGADVLKQLKCECGKTLTYDLERKAL